ncbi:hypothetical protein COS78_01740 [Candidatus Shapirobacteria bacterium CG06_land_8_20_14_3_00_40_12]|uniref:Uncharacterized protein n=2 Tax=Candidatus Shapironibacteriota TaxID=1752721 RepID=A0A2M7ASG9_9BACT|nr:MAG: hypothetical protein COS78_01740 [Candidatus Shapirobacteria bacterium CG06_land_8_20_14_3_00_40_12]
MTKIYKYRLIIILLIMVGLMGAVRWSYRNYPWEKAEVEVLLTPILTPTSAPAVDPDYPLWKLLPYSGKGFVVDRYIEPLTLAVTIKGIDKKIVEKEIVKWLQENKVATDSHKLIFN